MQKKDKILKSIRMNKRQVLLAIGLVVSIAAQAQPSRGQLIDNIVARVDNYIILRSDLEQAYQGYLAQGNQAGPDAKCQILQSLVLNKVMVAKAEIDSVIVDEGRIQAQLEYSLLQALQQFPTEAEFERTYGKTVDEFREELYPDMKENMIIQEMQAVITEGITVTPREVKRYYDRIPRDSLPFFSTEVVVGQFVKKPSTSQSEITRVTDFLIDLRNQVQRGEATFEELAAKYSEDPGSGRRGGNLGFANRGDMVPEYEEAALALSPNQISDPIESPFGYHLIQLIERRGNQYNSRHILIRPRSGKADMEEALAYLDSIRTLILSDENVRFAKLAKEHSDDMLTGSNGGFFTNPNAGGMRIPVKQLESSVFFTIDTMKVGSITPPIEFTTQEGDPAARIIYYKERVPPHQANLEDDYQKIKQAVLQSKKNEILMEWFEKARQQVYIYVEPEFQNCRILN